jgi:hypothetical protein
MYSKINVLTANSMHFVTVLILELSDLLLSSIHLHWYPDDLLLWYALHVLHVEWNHVLRRQRVTLNYLMRCGKNIWDRYLLTS